MSQYFVNAQNAEGSAGERPLIEADSPEEAQAIYESYGTGFDVIGVDPA